MKGLTLTTTEQTRLQVLNAVVAKLCAPPEAALGISERHVWRLLAAYRKEGAAALVAFIHYGALHLVLPGDLEAAGWRKLLENADFRTQLSEVNFFIAAHHGREGGYCPEVFDICKQAVIIISDDLIQYATQEVDYARHAKGILWNGTETRKVLTTRCDGMITIRHIPNVEFSVHAG